MKFYENQLFHIYNQGNNRRQIFFTDYNYEYFLWKMRAYLLPFGDLIAWCLMPNHFHWQFYVKRTSVERRFLRGYSDNVEYQRRLARYGEKAMEVDKKATRMADENEAVELNEAIGTLLNAYAKAINKEKGMSGSVFRKNCKAKDGWIDEFVSS